MEHLKAVIRVISDMDMMQILDLVLPVFQTVEVVLAVPIQDVLAVTLAILPIY